jgi:type II secretory pathway component GspD/PulD (secretin)
MKLLASSFILLTTLMVSFTFTVMPAATVSAENGAQHEPISLELADAELVNVLKTMAMVIGAEAEIDPAVSGRISITFADISWMTALDGICESGGCQWQLTGRNPRMLEITQAEPLSENAESFLDRPISMTLEKAAISDVIEQFGVFLKRGVQIDGQPRGSVTLSFERISVRTALNMVCESAGCQWQLVGDGVLQVSVADTTGPATATMEDVTAQIEAPISLTLEDADAIRVLKTFGGLFGCKVVVSEEVSGSVSIDLDRIPAGQALTRICEQVGCTWALTSEDGKPIIMISPL